MKTALIAAGFALSCAASTPSLQHATQEPAPLAPLPSARQLAWQELEFYAFTHFNMDTFTDREWGQGDEDPNLFNPTELDCRQWARVAKEAGMRGIILTAKHHDGFCLWPSKLTTHGVASSKWRDGKGDVLRELSDACKEFDLKLGLYLSPWDRNNPAYGTADDYNAYFAGQLREVLSSYGDVFEVWFDGACGEGANGKKQVYDWKRFIAVVRELQPNAVMFSDVGPDIRWVGNEDGIAGETCWSMISPEGFTPGAGAPPTSVLNAGLMDGTHWIPAECDVSIRPGWYYHASQDGAVKSLAKLLDIYYGSVGRNGSMLLNLPVDRRGLVHENDAARLRELRHALDTIFAHDLARGCSASASNVRGNDERFGAARAVDADAKTYWATDDGVTSAQLTVTFAKPTLVDHAVIAEEIALGQRVERFTISAQVDGAWKQIAAATTVGHKRIVRFDPVRASAMKLDIQAARACPTIASFALYCSPPKVEIRSKDGVFLESTNVELATNQPGAEIRYTLDGSTPTRSSKLYTAPIKLDSTATITALAFRGADESLEPAQQKLVAYTKASLLPPVLHYDVESGVLVEKYEGHWSILSDLESAKPVARSFVTKIDLTQRTRDEDFALAFEGVIAAKAAGIFTFATTSDDGSRIYIDGHPVVDNDRAHGMQRVQGSIGLAEGLHDLRVEYFNAGGGFGLEVTWKGPGFEEQPIPASALFH